MALDAVTTSADTAKYVNWGTLGGADQSLEAAQTPNVRTRQPRSAQGPLPLRDLFNNSQ